MGVWDQFLLFVLKFGIFFGAIIIFILLIAILVTKSQHKPELEITNLSEKLKKSKFYAKSQMAEGKAELKALKKEIKADEKKSEKDETVKPRAFVLDFDGDVKASGAENFGQEITSILSIIEPTDQVVVRLESPGGVVHGYGLCASHLMRLRERNIPLTICVDKVAASGGYMMACVANQIIAAPFAIVGSIGVVAQVPNVNKLLKKHDIEYNEYTAGDYKRTVSVFAENTEKGIQKFKEQLEETHILFKDFVGQFRPQLDLAQVTTGEYWFAKKAIEYKLVDKIQTSSDFLLSLDATHTLYHFSLEKKKTLSDKLSEFMGKALTQAIEKTINSLNKLSLP